MSTPYNPLTPIHRAPVPRGTAPTIVEPEVPNWSRDLIKEIAMDIGKELVAYIEVMYPQAIEATSSTFKLSMRNHIHNDIISALDALPTEEKARAWLERRKKFRRERLAQWRKIRAMP